MRIMRARMGCVYKIDIAKPDGSNLSETGGQIGGWEFRDRQGEETACTMEEETDETGYLKGTRAVSDK